MRLLICLAILALVHGAPVDNTPADTPAPQEEPALEAEAPLPEAEAPVPEAEAPAPEAIVEVEEPVADPEPPVSVVNVKPEKLAAEPEKPDSEPEKSDSEPEKPEAKVPELAAAPEPPKESFSEAYAPEAPATESPPEVHTLPPHFHPYTIPEDEWIISSQPEYNPKPETTFIDELLWALFGDDDEDDPRLERFSGVQAISSPTSYTVKPIKAEGAAVFMLYAD